MTSIQFDSQIQLFQKLEFLTSKIGSSKRRFPSTMQADYSQQPDSDQLYKPVVSA